MKISILTLFPEMFEGPFEHSIIKRAQQKKKVKIEFINIRNFSIGRHKIVDDKPFGGGVGMVLRVDVIDRAISNIKKGRIILLDPRGKTFNQKKARELAKLDHLIFIAGHYEGVDERVRKYLVDESLSIGNYVLTGGEIPAMVIVDSIVRLIPGVLAKPEATSQESFAISNLLEHPQYTRPQTYKNWKVPKVLLTGNHKKIEAWKKAKSLSKRIGS